MKVLFTKLVPNVGHVGDIKDVSDSYARNFLIPKWLAKRLSPEDEKTLELKQKKEFLHKQELTENKHQIAQELQGYTFVIFLKTAANGKVFWSIWEKDIIDLVYQQFKIKLEKKHIDMGTDGHIKKVGKREVFIKLSSETSAKIIIDVQSQWKQ